MVLLSILVPSLTVGADISEPLSSAQQLIEQGKYGEALEDLRELKQRPDCGKYCRAEAHLLAGLCRLRLGQSGAAYGELVESIRLRPKYRPTQAQYGQELVEVYSAAKKEVLCSIEIRVGTPSSIALEARGGFYTIYREDNVPAGSIELKECKYGQAQRYRLIAGRVNAFDLILEKMHDFHSYDSLHLSFRPCISEDTVSEVEAYDPESYSCVRIGKFCVDLQQANYSDEPITRITVEDGNNINSIYVFESKPEWQKLHQQLASNPGRRKLAKVIKYASILGTTATALLAWRENSRAEDKYDEYMSKANFFEINETYRAYEELISNRNVLGGFAISFAAAGILSYLLAPRDEAELISEFEETYRPSGIKLDVRFDTVGAKLVLTF
ncbi:MAG: hypothetical protein JSU74_08240 [Candidatus Zixiibacteriota bacterium]|nr:MAG: hypothetical protein JSU74_08240 [candidate division Zixibacteria bacterium]